MGVGMTPYVYCISRISAIPTMLLVHGLPELMLMAVNFMMTAVLFMVGLFVILNCGVVENSTPPCADDTSPKEIPEDEDLNVGCLHSAYDRCDQGP